MRLVHNSHLHSNKNLHFSAQDRFIRIFPTSIMSALVCLFGSFFFFTPPFRFSWLWKISGQNISLYGATNESHLRRNSWATNEKEHPQAGCEEAPGGILLLWHSWDRCVARASPATLHSHTENSPNEPGPNHRQPKLTLGVGISSKGIAKLPPTSKGAGSAPGRSEINPRGRLCQANPWQGGVFLEDPGAAWPRERWHRRVV